MRLIPLGKGFYAFVDDEDYQLLAAYNWRVRRSPRGKTYYAYRDVKVSGRTRHVHMHREILGAHLWEKGEARFVDHRNGHGLDNRRGNLRLATRSQNAHNVGSRKHSSVRYKGVSLRRKYGTYSAMIWADNKCHYLGCFPTAEEAAHKYDEAAKQLHGEFAWLNFCE